VGAWNFVLARTRWEVQRGEDATTLQYSLITNSCFINVKI